jgi:hypothetical protein
MESKKLYIIQFGYERSHADDLFSYPSEKDAIYVMASSYDQAASKAEIFIESSVTLKKPNILDENGSLNLSMIENGPPKIISIRESRAKILW